jgi:acyl-CoA synthetase (NDP forming)
MTEVAAEVMAGLAHDRPFGPVVMFGLGGVLLRASTLWRFAWYPYVPGMRAP